MSDKSKIEWTDATWNPVTGCSKVSQGCKHCYAERGWGRLVHMPAFAGRVFTDVACHPERVEQPLRWNKPRRVFVNSISDLFHESVPDDFIANVFRVMASAKQHTFQMLTKRPARMLEWFGKLQQLDRLMVLPVNDVMGIFVGMIDSWPLANVWIGVSIEDQATADERIPLLLQTSAAVRWVSAEPLLGPVDLTPWLDRSWPNCDAGFQQGEHMAADYCGRCGGHISDPVHTNPQRVIDWLVVGGESGPRARPMHPNWARCLRDECAAAGVPFLFKQWGSYVSAEQASCDLNTCYDKSIIGAWVNPNGSYGLGENATPVHKDAEHVFKLPKNLAGRLLDGTLHDNYPEVSK